MAFDKGKKGQQKKKSKIKKATEVMQATMDRMAKQYNIPMTLTMKKGGEEEERVLMETKKN